VKTLSPQAKRKQLEKKIIQIFQEEMKKLTTDLQKILADDLVTAFLNRMTIFTEIQTKPKTSTSRKHSLNP
jgi:GMP synthase PP-ATPase subunit